MAELLTVGHAARPALNPGGTVWQPSTWIDVGATLPTDGVVTRWRLYCRVPRVPVRLQIWRPMIGRTFRLVGETVVRPTAAGVFRVRNIYSILCGILRSTPPSRLNTMGLKCPSERTSVFPQKVFSISMTFGMYVEVDE